MNTSAKRQQLIITLQRNGGPTLGLVLNPVYELHNLPVPRWGFW
jgi:hypothetical protein